MVDEPQEAPPPTTAPLETHVRIVARYTIVVTLLSILAFVLFLDRVPSLGSGNPTTAPTEADLRRSFVLTTALMFVAGALGGCLYNFRGLVKHVAEGDYEAGYNLSYYLRPLSGGICGLIVFFLLLGGALTFNAQAVAPTAQGEVPAWGTLLGRMPYVAFALLAGYSSHEFMLKLKDLADSLFVPKRNGGSGEG